MGITPPGLIHLSQPQWMEAIWLISGGQMRWTEKKDGESERRDAPDQSEERTSAVKTNNGKDVKKMELKG